MLWIRHISFSTKVSILFLEENILQEQVFYSLITSRVEVNILRSINPHFAKVKVIKFKLIASRVFIFLK